MICPQLVNVTMESHVLPSCGCVLGVQSAPLDGVSSTRQFRNRKLHIFLLKLSADMFEFLADSVWQVFVDDAFSARRC